MEYPCLNKAGCTTVNGVDDKEEQNDMRKAMDILQYRKEDQALCFQTLAAILALSKVEFTVGDGGEDSSKVTPETRPFTETAARLLGMEVR
jgi:myosin heavy subunit